MKNAKKLLIALALILTVCSVAGIIVSAEGGEPTLEIYSKNLSYDSNISILFAVKAENTEDAEIILNVYEEDPQVNAQATPVKSVAKGYTDTVHGVECDIFYTPGISAKNIHRQVYVQAVATVSGAEIKSEVERYSILEYCYEMISDAESDEEAAKYQAVINYGAAIQSLLSNDTYEDGTPKFSGALATEYKYVTISGGTLDGKYSEGIYLAGAKITPTGSDVKYWNVGGVMVKNGESCTVSESANIAVSDRVTFDGLTDMPEYITNVGISGAPALVNNNGSYASVAPSLGTLSAYNSYNATKYLYLTNINRAGSSVFKIDETAAADDGANAVVFEAGMLINWASTSSANREFLNVVFTKADGTIAYNLILRNTTKTEDGTNLGIVTRNSSGSATGNCTFVFSADGTKYFNIEVVYKTVNGALAAEIWCDGTLINTHSAQYGDTVIDPSEIANVYVYVNCNSDSSADIIQDIVIDNIKLSHVVK